MPFAHVKKAGPGPAFFGSDANQRPNQSIGVARVSAAHPGGWALVIFKAVRVRPRVRCAYPSYRRYLADCGAELLE